MKVFSTTERLKYIMEERHLRQKDIYDLAAPYCCQYGERLGLADISAYVTGKYQPAQKKLAILAMALNVSEGWLMGMPVPMERDDNVDANKNIGVDTISTDEIKLLRLFRSLNSEGREALMEQAEMFASKDKYTIAGNSSASSQNQAV